MKSQRIQLSILLASMVVGCGSTEEQTPTVVDDGKICTFEAADYPVLTTPCALGTTSPTRLAITTTDFSTGGLSIVDLGTKAVTKDVAVTTTDAIPFYQDGSLYVVNRFGHDFVERFNASTYASLGEYPISFTEQTSPNPHSIAFTSEGHGLIPSNGHHMASVLDFGQAHPNARVKDIDLSAFADGDGNPEASLSFSCGNISYISVQRLENFAAVDCDLLVPVDVSQNKIYASAIPLAGQGAKQIRQDPSDTTGHSVLVLASGIERVNLKDGSTTALITTEQLVAAVGGDSFNYRLADFDINSDGTLAYLAISAADYSSMSIWRASLSGTPNLEEVITGVNASERTLTVVGDELWFGDTTLGASGMRVYDLTQNPPSEIGSVRNTGLAPYSVVAIP